MMLVSIAGTDVLSQPEYKLPMDSMAEEANKLMPNSKAVEANKACSKQAQNNGNWMPIMIGSTRYQGERDESGYRLFDYFKPSVARLFR